MWLEEIVHEEDMVALAASNGWFILPLAQIIIIIIFLIFTQEKIKNYHKSLNKINRFLYNS